MSEALIVTVATLLVALRLFCDNQPEDELEGDGASPVSANDHVLAPCAHGLERLA